MRFKHKQPPIMCNRIQPLEDVSESGPDSPTVSMRIGVSSSALENQIPSFASLCVHNGE